MTWYRTTSFSWTAEPIEVESETKDFVMAKRFSLVGADRFFRMKKHSQYEDLWPCAELALEYLTQRAVKRLEQLKTEQSEIEAALSGLPEKYLKPTK